MISRAFNIDLQALLESEGADTDIDVEEFVPRPQITQVFTPNYFG